MQRAKRNHRTSARLVKLPMIDGIKAMLRRRSITPRARHLELGKRGEGKALQYLTEYEGYRIVATNFVVPLGRGLRGQKLTAEIDVIVYDDDTLGLSK